MRPVLVAARAPRVFALVASLLLAPSFLPVARADDVGLARSGLGWLASQPELTSLAPYAVEAAAALNVDAARWPSASAPIAAAAASYASYGGAIYGIERAAHALGSDGYDPRAAGGQDLVATIRSNFDGVQFGSATFINDDMWAILALRAAGVPSSDGQIQSAADFVLTHRGADGGWSHTTLTASSNTDMTGAALAALAAAGRSVVGDVAAARFLDSMARADGGHADTSAHASSNCQSTVWAIHGEALLGASQDADLAFLRTLTNPDGGFFLSYDTRHQPGRSNFLCTAEAVVALAGARYPLVGFASATLSAPARVTRGEALTLQLDGRFSSIQWTTPWGALDGPSQNVTPTRAGAFDIGVTARGPDGIHRRHFSLRVDPLPPHIALDAKNVTLLRGEWLTFSPTLWADEGRSVRAMVDWGEAATSAASTTLSHAYATPGNRTARVWAVDDLGTRSEMAFVNISVVNRAPVWGALPARLDVDRRWQAPKAWNVTDPDGDPVEVQTLVVGGVTLGEHEVQLTARDGYGGESHAHLTLVVRNVAPTLGPLRLPERAQADEPFYYSVQAADPDGDAPRVIWSFGNRELNGAAGRVALPAGNYTVTVNATDADGGATRLEALLSVAPVARASPIRAPPEANASTVVPPPDAAPLAATIPDDASPWPATPPAPAENDTSPEILTAAKAPTTRAPSPSSRPLETPTPWWLALAAAILAARRRRAS